MKNITTFFCKVTLAAIFLFTLVSKAHAFDSDKCHKVTNQGWWRQYDYVPPIGFKISTDHTHKDGVSSTSKATTQNSTASLDPGVTTHQSQSDMQYTSSYGDCRWLGMNELKDERERFVALNLEQIKKEASVGGGAHIKTLASLSKCDDVGTSQLQIEMQKNLSNFIDLDAKKTSDVLGQITSDQRIAGHCGLI
jgi:hypothetical protein